MIVCLNKETVQLKTILISNSLYFPNIVGGAEISTQILAESLTTKYKVYVLTLSPTNKEIVREVINGVHVIRVPYKNIYWPFKIKNDISFLKLFWHLINLNNPLMKKQISKVLNEVKPDIIHTQNNMGMGLYLWELGSKMNIPVIHTTRDYALFSPTNQSMVNYLYKRNTLKLENNLTKVVGISNYILTLHDEEGIFKNIDKKIIYNVVSDHSDNKNIKTTSNSPLKIGFFGQLIRIKGIDTLIDAVKEISPDIVGKLYICGEGELKNELSATIDPRINFLGKVGKETVKDLMHKCDLVVVPSRWGEPFGSVVIESYAQGTPVLVTNDGGLPEIVYKPKQFLIEKCDKHLIKKAIIDYFELDITEKNEIIKGCLKYSELFNDEKSLEIHIDMYEEILNMVK